MKSFERFLKEEVDLRGNKGVPEDFMRKAEEEARIKKGVRPDDDSQMRRIWPEFSQLMQQSNQIVNMENGRMLNRQQITERNQKLEQLAYDVVMDEFGEILAEFAVPVELVIKLTGNVMGDVPNLGQVPQRPEQPREQPRQQEQQKKEEDEENKDKEKECQTCAPGEEQPEEPQETIELNLKSAIEKKKILNMITQGAGKKTKDIIRYSEKVRDGIQEIFGGNSQTLLDCWIRMSEEADKMDWAIPIGTKSQMMKNSPSGMAGACEVIWESLSGQKYDIKLILEKEATKITVKAVGVDFPMLIHESVKGIFLLLQSVAIKSGEAGKAVKKATSSFSDESQDFRYGPPALQMLLEFVNMFPDSTRYKNLHARVFKFLAQDKQKAQDELKYVEELYDNASAEDKSSYKVLLTRMKARYKLYKTDDHFLDVMNSLFSTFDLIRGEFTLNEEKFENSMAKKEIKEIVEFIVKEDEYLKKQNQDWQDYLKAKEEEDKLRKKREEEGEFAKEEEEESDIDKLVKQSLYGTESEKEETDYSKMSDSQLAKLSPQEIQSAINKAVQEEDYEFADKLTKKFLKGESKKVWETELRRINEMYKLHTKRK